MNWYQTSKYSIKIDAVEVERETESAIWLKPYPACEVRRRSKHSSFEDYWPSLQEATNYLRDRVGYEIVDCERNLADLRKDLDKLEPAPAGAEMET